ncbi:hypothetical protein ACLESD_26250 [Pyxidicoccus sp. 3LFB2]
MPRPPRLPLLLSALVATFATAARADAPVSPVPMIVVDKGTISLLNKDGSRLLADCQVHREIRMLSGPTRGTMLREQEPCYLSGLTVHPRTGRWAVGASIMNHTVRMTLGGREFVPPTDKTGRLKQGTFLVLGDRKGVVAVTSGNAETWTSNGKFISQSPMAFTEDGARVLVMTSNSSSCQWWSWSFAPQPGGLRVLPPGVTDFSCNQVVAGEHRTVLKHPRDGVRIATLDPTGTKPWKVGRPLPQSRRKMNTALVLGDTMVFFREGLEYPEDGVGCDESKPGTYRRVELSTGEERVWHTLDGECYTGEFLMANARRRTVYFQNGRDRVDGGERLFEHDLESDTTRELEIHSLYKVHDLSADGRTLLLFTYDKGPVLYDVDSASVVEVGGSMSKDGEAKLLGSR